MRRRTAIIAIAITATLVPVPVSAADVRGFVRGDVLVGESAEAEELELSAEELVFARRRVNGARVGIMTVEAGSSSLDGGVPEDIVTSATERLAAVGVAPVTCRVGQDAPTVDACIDLFASESVLGVIFVGVPGDLTAATQRVQDLNNRPEVVSVGPSTVADGTIRLMVDPITQATEQGHAAGVSLGPVAPKRKGRAVVVGGVDPGAADPVADAAEASLRDAAKKIKIAGRVGPPAVQSVDELEALLGQLPRSRLAVGQGVLLEDADAEGLERLPADFSLVAWRCTPKLMALVDLGSRLRGCVARADDIAGEAAANAFLTIFSSRDVPSEIEVPVYAYRGTVPVGPGKVQLGRRVSGSSLVITGDELTDAAGALAGRTVGVVTLDEPGAAEGPATRQTRESVEAYLAGLGATITECNGAGDRRRVVRCVTDLTQQGVAGIVTISTKADLTAAANAAVEAGVMVVGYGETRLGDQGAIYTIVNPRSVGRLNGRMAGNYADEVWPYDAVEVAVLNDRGPEVLDIVAASIERAMRQTKRDIAVVGRFASEGAKLGTALTQVLKKNPGVRMIVGDNAARAAQALERRKRVPSDMVLYTLACDADIVATIDADVWLKGCVDTDPDGAGELVGRAMARLAAGGTVSEVLEVPVAPYPGF